MKQASLTLAVALAIGMSVGANGRAIAQELDLNYYAPKEVRVQLAAAKHDLLTKKKKDKDRAAEDATSANGAVDHSTHTMDPNMDHSTMDHATHHHGAGMWMLEYRFMRMNMKGMLKGAKEVNPKDLLPTEFVMEGDLMDPDVEPHVDPLPNPNYPDFTTEDGHPESMVSEDMTMDMHMFMAMYSFTDRLTGMVMMNYLVNEMTMTMRMGMPMWDEMMGEWMLMDGYMEEAMSMKSSGLGDTQIGITYQLENWRQFSPLLTVMLNVPTGSIDEKDEDGEMLPYSMQLGSGSYDLTVGLNLKSKVDQWTTGLEGQYTWRMKNYENYSLGDWYRLRAWASYDMKAKDTDITLRGGLDHTQTEEIEGRDDRIMENTDYYGAMRTDLRLGASVGLPRGHMVEFLWAKPVHQDVNGYQMKTDSMWELAWQWMF